MRILRSTTILASLSEQRFSKKAVPKNSTRTKKIFQTLGKVMLDRMSLSSATEILVFPLQCYICVHRTNPLHRRPLPFPICTKVPMQHAFQKFLRISLEFFFAQSV